MWLAKDANFLRSESSLSAMWIAKDASFLRSESSLGAMWIAKDANFLHTDNEDWSDLVGAQAVLSRS